MKRILFSLALLFSLLSLNAQTVAKMDKDGNFTQTEVAKTVESLTKTATKTGKVFTDKDGNKHDVFKSKNGKYFYVATSKKTGNLYAKYFTVE